MAHSVSTAEKHYHIRNKLANAVVGSEAVSQYYAQSPTKAVSSPKSPVSPRYKWSKEEEVQLKEIFCEEVNSGNIAVEAIRPKIANLDTSASEKQLLDKLRSFVRKTPPKIDFRVIILVIFRFFLSLRLEYVTLLSFILFLICKSWKVQINPSLLLF